MVGFLILECDKGFIHVWRTPYILECDVHFQGDFDIHQFFLTNIETLQKRD